jgi:hypothetical protein
MLRPFLLADRVYCKVAAVGGDTDRQPFTQVLTRIVHKPL